jgi:hypothetical protein
MGSGLACPSLGGTWARLAAGTCASVAQWGNVRMQRHKSLDDGTEQGGGIATRAVKGPCLILVIKLQP